MAAATTRSFVNPPPGVKCTALLTDVVFAKAVYCSSDSDYSFWVIQTPPDTNDALRVCQSASCQSMVDDMRRVAPTECVMSDGFYLYQDILNPILNKCTTANGTWTVKGHGEVPTARPTNKTEPCGLILPAITIGNAHGGLTCAAESSYSFFVLSQPPTLQQTTKICASAACTQLRTAIKAAVPNDCTVQNSNLILFEQILDPIESICTATAAMNGSVADKNGSMADNTTATAVIGSDATKSRGRNVTFAIGVTVGAVLALSLVVLIALWRTRRNRKHGSKHSSVDTEYAAYQDADEENPPQDPLTLSSSPTAFNAVIQRRGDDGTTTRLWSDHAIESIRVPLEEIHIEELLSRGAFGEVLRGSFNGQQVAVKRLLPERRKNMAEIEAFLEEAKLMTTLHHPRIVSLIGVAWDSLSDLCIVAEFMDGGDLRSLLSQYDSANHPTGFNADKLKIAMHVAHALSYLHGLQPSVVHRDLKSKNVLLSSDLDAKLTDFGASRTCGDVKMTAAVGSSLWMAPEVVMGDHYDEKADIFSFGVLLSELDTQLLPYAHATEPGTDRKLPELAILQMVSMGLLSVAFSDTTDVDLIDLARACVAVDPADRPTAEQVFQHLHDAVV